MRKTRETSPEAVVHTMQKRSIPFTFSLKHRQTSPPNKVPAAAAGIVMKPIKQNCNLVFVVKANFPMSTIY